MDDVTADALVRRIDRLLDVLEGERLFGVGRVPADLKLDVADLFQEYGIQSRIPNGTAQLHAVLMDAHAEALATRARRWRVMVGWGTLADGPLPADNAARAPR